MKPWHAHYDQGVPLEAPSPWLLTDLLRESVRRYPKRVALEFLGRRLTYEALWREVEAFAQGLQARGVQKGTRVAIMLPNSPQFVIAFYGTLLAGGVAVNTNPMYTPRELRHQLLDSGAEVLVILDQLLPRYLEVQKEVPVRLVVRTGLQDYLPFPKNLLYPLRLRRQGQWPPPAFGVAWREFLGRGSPSPVPLDLDDLALIQYTGGTTGVSKGAMLTHRALSANALQVRSWTPDFEEGKEVVLGAIPFFHVYGMTVGMNLALSGGASLILLPRPEIKAIVEAIEKHGVTLFPGVPTLYVAFNRFPGIEKRNLRTLKACISGSAPLPLEVAETFERLTGAKLVEGYGLTEASPVTHCSPLYGTRKKGSVGLPLPGVDAKVVDEEGQEVPLGEVGELIVKGPNIMKGYWNRPEETQRALKDGWLYTGDMARMDQDGYFYIVDRKKDMIIAGGYNIYPREVEEVLYQHPAVQEAAVVGVPDPYRGETVAAFIVLKDEYKDKVTREDIEKFCRENLAAYKVPRIIEFRESLPKSAVGKVLKRELAPQKAVH
ncbi:long-chain-fatty-acid--CoA ligase [Thermus filiformis]|uniref:Long-chain fatty acid--CoA ligase n=1 Tax=Thermus filiformis TaxID=276 RepID=A0A0A2WRK3_THEFI|nr:long-chain fatty acid--CoA ligase [Thermus filiformis]KGQ21397.2 long-chain fatty acid--CoA ligase [Thermus filiformis]